MLNMVAPNHTKNVKCNSLGLALAIDPPYKWLEFLLLYMLLSVSYVISKYQYGSY